MGQQWMELQQWIFPRRRFFREELKLAVRAARRGATRDNRRGRLRSAQGAGRALMGKGGMVRRRRAGLWQRKEARSHARVFVMTQREKA